MSDSESEHDVVHCNSQKSLKYALATLLNFDLKGQRDGKNLHFWTSGQNFKVRYINSKDTGTQKALNTKCINNKLKI